MLMVDDIREAIYKKERLIDELKSKGDDAYKQFVKNTVVCLTSWYNERVNKYLTETNPDKILNKSQDEIDKLRKQILTFTNSFEKMFSESVNKGGKTWHQRSINDLNSNDLGDKIIIDKAISLILQEAINKSYFIEHDIIEFIRHNEHITWSPEMTTQWDNYKKTHQQAIPIFEELKGLNQQLKNQQEIEKQKIAKAKWDKEDIK